MRRRGVFLLCCYLVLNVCISGESRLTIISPKINSPQEQPFSVSVEVSLSGTSFDRWRMCYEIEGKIAPYCSLLIVTEESRLVFSPESGQAPPEFDDLADDRPHRLNAWFSLTETDDDNNDGDTRWGFISRNFTVIQSAARTKNGDYRYLAEKVLQRPHLVSGMIIEPRNIPQQIFRAINNVMTQLPSVRPIHLFHGLHFNACPSLSPSVLQLLSAAASSLHSLCNLVKLEVVIPHRLTVDDLTHRAYNRFMMQPDIWDLMGGDQILVFQTDTVVCSGWASIPHHTTPRTKAIRRLADFKHLDYVGGRQQLSYLVGNPPREMKYELKGGNGGLSLRNVALSKACAVDSMDDASAEQEDVHFPNCMESKGGRVATAEEQDEFVTYGGGSEQRKQLYDEQFPPSLGAHKLDTSKERIASFVDEVCPEWYAVVESHGT